MLIFKMDIEKLIELVRTYQVLYDTSHEDYMRTKLKDGIWKKIAEEMNTDGKYKHFIVINKSDK